MTETGAVMVEARRIARNRVKKALKKRGLKISWFAAKDITLASMELIKEDKAITRQARYNLKRRAHDARRIRGQAQGPTEGS